MALAIFYFIIFRWHLILLLSLNIIFSYFLFILLVIFYVSNKLVFFLFRSLLNVFSQFPDVVALVLHAELDQLHDLLVVDVVHMLLCHYFLLLSLLLFLQVLLLFLLLLLLYLVQVLPSKDIIRLQLVGNVRILSLEELSRWDDYIIIINL